MHLTQVTIGHWDSNNYDSLHTINDPNQQSVIDSKYTLIL